jgi:hypothetical protein
MGQVQCSGSGQAQALCWWCSANMGAACSKTRLEGAIAHWSLPSAGSRDKRVTLAACADEPRGQPFDHSGWTAVLQAC